MLHKQLAQRFAILRLQPRVGGDAGEYAAGPQQPHALLIEEAVEVARFLERLVAFPLVLCGLGGYPGQLQVRWVGNHDIKAARFGVPSLEDFGEKQVPEKVGFAALLARVGQAVFALQFVGQ